MRTTYKAIEKGIKTNRDLSQGMINRLEEIGFQWRRVDHDDAFEKRPLSRSDSVQRGVWALQYSSKVCEQSIIRTLV